MTSASRLLSTRGPLTPLNRPSGSKNSVQFLLGGRRLDQLLVQSGTRLSNWSTNGREKMCSIAEELHLSRESSLNTGDRCMNGLGLCDSSQILAFSIFDTLLCNNFRSEFYRTELSTLCPGWESEAFFNQASKANWVFTVWLDWVAIGFRFHPDTAPPTYILPPSDEKLMIQQTEKNPHNIIWYNTALGPYMLGYGW